MKLKGPLTGYAVVTVLFLISLVFAQKGPRITALEPEVINPGEVLTIRGEYFGDSLIDGTLLIGGVTMIQSHILEWKDNLIRIRMFDTLKSGLVSISTRYGTSPGVLLTSLGDVPKILAAGNGRSPELRADGPLKARPGDTLVLNGSLLGESGASHEVLVSWGPTQDNQWYRTQPQDILSWSDQEVRILVPSGAKTGPIKVKTPDGESNVLILEVDTAASSLGLNSRKTYSFSMSYDVDVQSAGPEAQLYLWVPSPASTPRQRNVKILSQSGKPYVSGPDMDLYRFQALGSGQRTRITRDFSVDVYAQAVILKPDQMTVKAEEYPRNYQEYLESEPQIPTGDPAIIALSGAATAGERSPGYKTLAMIRNLGGDFLIDTQRSGMDVLGALKTKSASPRELSFLYTAFFRAQKIPARPVAGLLYTGGSTMVYHYWLEVQLPGAGWIPLDPVLASGFQYGSFPESPNPPSWYLGNMDNRHIALVVGTKEIRRFESGSRLGSSGPFGGFQGFSEEASPSLENYSVIWHDVAVTGVN